MFYRALAWEAGKCVLWSAETMPVRCENPRCIEGEKLCPTKKQENHGMVDRSLGLFLMRLFPYQLNSNRFSSFCNSLCSRNGNHWRKTNGCRTCFRKHSGDETQECPPLPKR